VARRASNSNEAGKERVAAILTRAKPYAPLIAREFS